ncbi:hypothetical protein MPC4_70021 [Methylocella tundrae]|uniref:Uncharacterized protein n=1 Tax=Methylocella tundrae TaxID=227605 RepID=A0A8B6MB46_METTU|nr:hypothetical protein MPC4_70021 [Methylocella tundrae]
MAPAAQTYRLQRPKTGQTTLTLRNAPFTDTRVKKLRQ